MRRLCIRILLGAAVLILTTTHYGMAKGSNAHAFLELGGNALLYSLNLEIPILSPKINWRVGVAYYPGNSTVWVFPWTVGVRLKRHSPLLELGAGLLVIYEPDYEHVHTWGTFILGLRWEWPRHPFVFRVVLTPFIPWSETVLSDESSFTLVPWIGISFGVHL